MSFVLQEEEAMRIFLIDHDVSVQSSMPFEHFKSIVESYRRGYVEEAIIPVEFNGSVRRLCISAVDSAKTFAEFYNSVNDRKQLEDLGQRIGKTRNELNELAEKLGGGK
jgi:hypothetical protein